MSPMGLLLWENTAMIIAARAPLSSSGVENTASISKKLKLMVSIAIGCNSQTEVIQSQGVISKHVPSVDPPFHLWHMEYENE